MKKLTLILVLLFISCGTKTKNKNSSEFVEKTNAEVVKKDSINKIETIITQRVEEKLTEYREENKSDVSDKIKVTETTETLNFEGGEALVIETPQGITRISGNGRITKHTRTAYQELERQSISQMNIELAEKLQYQIDQNNQQTITKQAITEVATEIVTKNKQENKEKEVKTQLNFWVYFWIIIIILLVYFGYKLYMKYGSPLGWFKLIFK